MRPFALIDAATDEKRLAHADRQLNARCAGAWTWRALPDLRRMIAYHLFGLWTHFKVDWLARIADPDHEIGERSKGAVFGNCFHCFTSKDNDDLNNRGYFGLSGSGRRKVPSLPTQALEELPDNIGTFDLPANTAANDLGINEKMANFETFDEHCDLQKTTFSKYENDVRLACKLTRAYFDRPGAAVQSHQVAFALLKAKHKESFPHAFEKDFEAAIISNNYAPDTYRNYASVARRVVLYLMENEVKYSDYKKNPEKYRAEIESYVPPLQWLRVALDMIEQAVLASGKNIDETSQPNQQSLFDYGLTQGVYDKDGKPPVR
jgi:hypothetical protein